MAALFPSAAGADAGLLRLFQGHPHSKEGRKAPEVLFERETVYIWNVQMAGGDLNYVLQENDKVFVEVTDLLFILSFPSSSSSTSFPSSPSSGC